MTPPSVAQFVSAYAGAQRDTLLTPALVFGLLDTARERGGADVPVSRISGVGRLADDELALWDARGRDLEECGIRPGRARGGEQAGAGRVLIGALCGHAREKMIAGKVGLGIRL